jgi:hypothetical protein
VLDAIYNSKWRQIFIIQHLRLDFDLVMWFANHMLIGLFIGLSLVDNNIGNQANFPRRWYYQNTIEYEIARTMLLISKNYQRPNPRPSAMWQPYFTLLLLYFSGLTGSLIPARLNVENWVTLKPVLLCVRNIALFYYPSCKDSIKPVGSDCRNEEYLLYLYYRLCKVENWSLFVIACSI